MITNNINDKKYSQIKCPKKPSAPGLSSPALSAQN